MEEDTGQRSHNRTPLRGEERKTGDQGREEGRKKGERRRSKKL